MTSPHPAAPHAATPAAPAPLRPEDLPPFLRFSPVPVKPRHDGWSAELQLRFVLALARGAGVDEAARRVGRTRQGAYRLRGKAGAEGFARAWDAAGEFARRVAGETAAAGLPLGGIETMLVPRFYRGRLIGYVQREHVAGMMRTLGRLYRLGAQFEAREKAREPAGPRAASPAAPRRGAAGER